MEKADKGPAGVPWAFPTGPARSWMLLSTSPALTQAGTHKPALVTPLPGGQVLPTGTQPPLPDAGPEPRGGGVWGGGRSLYSATCHCREGLWSLESEGEESWRPWGGGDVWGPGRATSAFLILRREDPQKVPEPRGRKSGESQASWGGGGGVESRVSQGRLHP